MSTASRARSYARREARILEVTCPFCGARPGQRCRNPIPHKAFLGPADRRQQPAWPHNERRAEYVRLKGLAGHE